MYEDSPDEIEIKVSLDIVLNKSTNHIYFN